MANGDPVRLGFINGADNETRINMNATSDTFCGLRVRTPRAPGVIGHSDEQPGVLGTSGVHYGVWGGSQTHIGVYATSRLGPGCFGQSVSGSGTLGVSQDGIGVVGEGKSAGVYATINQRGSAKGAVHAYMPGVAGSTPAFYAQCQDPGNQTAAKFEGGVHITARGLTIDSGRLQIVNGQIDVSGSITTKEYVYCKDVVIQSPITSGRDTSTVSGAQHLRPLACPDGRLEAFGRAEMVQGRAEVQLDGTLPLAQDYDYHVFLTPEGDSNGLYVSSRSASGFEVREQQGGRNELTFSYRVVAKRQDVQTPAAATTAPREATATQAPEETSEPSVPLPKPLQGPEQAPSPLMPSPPTE